MYKEFWRSFRAASTGWPHPQPLKGRRTRVRQARCPECPPDENCETRPCVATHYRLQRALEFGSLINEDHGRSEVLPHVGKRGEVLNSQRVRRSDRSVGNP